MKTLEEQAKEYFDKHQTFGDGFVPHFRVKEIMAGFTEKVVNAKLEEAAKKATATYAYESDEWGMNPTLRAYVHKESILSLKIKKYKMRTLLWLDDYRDPYGDFAHWVEVFSPLSGNMQEVIWVKDYEEFTDWIHHNGLPDAISFDHDLNDLHYTPAEVWDNKEIGQSYKDSVEYWRNREPLEKTGFDCAKFLVEYCMNFNRHLPKWYTHSANPVGRDNINKYLINYLRNEG